MGNKLAIPLIMVLTNFGWCAPASPLPIESKHIVAAVKNRGLYIMIDLLPYRQKIVSLSELEANASLQETAVEKATEYLKKTKFQTLKKVEVEYIALASLDEYGQPDYSKKQSLGSVYIEKNGPQIKSAPAKNLDLSKLR